MVNEIGTFLDHGAGDSDVIVFRTHGDDGAALLAEAARGYLLQRASRPVWLLELRDAQPRLIDAATGSSALPTRALESAYVDILREAELSAYALAPGVYLDPSDTFHYVAPNGRHYRAFLRVGNMLRSVDAVDALCFWLVPRIGAPRVLLLDSTTILSVGLRLAQYLNEHGAGQPVTVEALRRYREEEVTLAPRLRRLRDEEEIGRPRLVFLESVSSLGGLIDYIREICSSRLGFQVEAIPLFSTVAVAEHRGWQPLCHIGEVSDALDDPCPLCSEGSQKVTLLPTSYTLEVAADCRTSTIDVPDAARGKAYLKDYAGTDCVSLHRTEPETGRHHMIYIDGGELLDRSRRFKGRLRRKLDALAGTAGAILIPRHYAAQKLGDFAERRLGLPLLATNEEELPSDRAQVDRLPARWISALREQPHLLLIDDVVITSGRLRRYLNALEPLREAVPGLELTYLVGVARPDHEDTLLRIPTMLWGRGKFETIEEIVLPHWGEEECPWCRELRLIDRLESGAVAIDGALAERRQVLRDVGNGIRGNDALLVWQEPEIAALGGSIFGEGTQAEMFMSVAAAVQVLRNRGALDEEFRPPIARVLHPVRTFQQRYFEYRIQLLILRACRPHDLNTRLVQRDLVQTMATLLAGDHDPSESDPRPVAPAVREQRAELILAAAQDKLPRGWLMRRGDNEQQGRWIEHALNDGDPSIGRFLRAALETP